MSLPFRNIAIWTRQENMGNRTSFLGKLFNRFYKNNEVRIVMCGLDAAGKTTILYRLKLGEVVTTIPTIGFNVESVNYKNVTLTAWDVGGRDKIRPLWRHYYQNTDVIIFVVDSNDRDRVEECRDELAMFMSEDELQDCCVLVLANKQDLPNAMSIAELSERLELSKLPSNRAWHIQGTSAIRGDGLYEGLDWLKDTLTAKRVVKSVGKPTAEVKDSLVGKSGFLASWFPTISSYFT